MSAIVNVWIIRWSVKEGGACFVVLVLLAVNGARQAINCNVVERQRGQQGVGLCEREASNRF